MRHFDRLVVLGFDAMDITLVAELATAGRVPALASLIDASAWATTVVPPALVVGAIWPSITTGYWPDSHGFYCDLQIEPGTYEARRRGPADITPARLWDVLSEAGRQCTVLDAPLTTVSPEIKGAQLVEWGSHDRFSPVLAAPPELVDDVHSAFGTYPVQPKCDDYARDGRLPDLRRDLLRGVTAKEQLIARQLERGDDGLLLAVFGESHCAAHQFWANHDPAHPCHIPEQRAAIGDVLLEVYEAIDTSVGRLIEMIADDVPVVAIWSHGVGPHFDGGHLLSEILRRIDAHDRGSSRLVDLRERTIRTMQRRGRTARRAFPLDSARRFFKVPNNDLYGGIRINLRGREPRGRVSSGGEYEEVLAELTTSLLELRDPETERPVVRRVIRADHVYDGPRRHDLPDLFVDWVCDRPIDAVTSPRIGVVRGASTAIRTGDHRPRGFVAFRIPGAAPGQRSQPVPVVDIAPSISALLGVDYPACDGQPVDLQAVATGRPFSEVVNRLGGT